VAHIENLELRDLTSWNFIDLVDLIDFDFVNGQSNAMMLLEGRTVAHNDDDQVRNINKGTTTLLSLAQTPKITKVTTATTHAYHKQKNTGGGD
tara:strand:+ start:294 stop:572 length:279 start_codon:yes stop_codon:yes gene_type:complete